MRMFLSSLCLPLAMLLGGVLARDDQSSLKAIRDSEDQNVLPQILDKLRNIDQRLSNIEHHWNDQNMRGKKVPFSITRVEKRETMEFYRVKVMYEGSERPTSIAIGQKDRIVQLLEPVELGEVEFDVPRSAVRELTFLTFFLPDHTVSATLYVAKSPHSMDLPHLQFQILQGKDVQVNYPEEHLQLDYISEIEKIDNLLAFDSLTYQILLKSDKEDHVIERYNAIYSKHTGTPAPATLDIAGAGGSGGYKFGRYVLNSTVKNAEGMINFLFGAVFRCSQPCLVQTLQDVYTVKFYPKGQEPPFPQKSINFIHDDYRQNKAQFYCSDNSNDCQLSCEVLGEGLTSVDISRMISQDENQATPDISVINGVWGKSQLRLQNVSFEEAGEYMCEARSATNEASEVMNLVVVEPVKIIEQMSNVTHFENGTVLFTCVADGYPAPTITFERMDRSPMDKVSPEAQVLHLNSRVTLADLYLTDPELVGNVFGFFCDATNVPGSRSLINKELIDSKFLPIDPLYEYFDRIESQ